VPPARSGEAKAHATAPAAVMTSPATRIFFSPANRIREVAKTPLAMAAKAAGYLSVRHEHQI
jgi:hypothetical protein